MFITAKIAFIFTSLSAVQIYVFHIFTADYTFGLLNKQPNSALTWASENGVNIGLASENKASVFNNLKL